MTTPTKTCRICGQTLPLTIDHFYEERHNLDGFLNACIPCTRARNNNYHRTLYHTDPDYRAHMLEKSRKRTQFLRDRRDSK